MILLERVFRNGFIRRDSWASTTAARVVSVGGKTDGVLAGPVPYHADPVTKKTPVVMAEISYQRATPRAGGVVVSRDIRVHDDQSPGLVALDFTLLKTG